MVLILGEPLVAGLGTDQSGLFIRSRVIVAGAASSSDAPPDEEPTDDQSGNVTVPATPTGSFI